MALQLTPSKQRIRTGSIARDSSIENCVQNLNLRSGAGLLTITGDKIWRRHGPQTLSQAFAFVGRVVKFEAEGKTLLKKAVQQTLIESTKPRGIEEYNFSHPPLSDDEEEKNGSNIGRSNQNPRSNSKTTRG